MSYLQLEHRFLSVRMSKTKQGQFLELYQPIHERFEHFCRARVYGEMDFRDLMNETLLVAFEKFDSLRSKEAFLSFLFGISVRILANHHQKKKVDRFQKKDSIEHIHDKNSNPAQEADIHYLYAGLAQLGEEQRECILLFEIAGFSIKEIVEIQGVSESAVKQRLKRGREKLIEILTFESTFKTGEVHHG